MKESIVVKNLSKTFRVRERKKDTIKSKLTGVFSGQSRIKKLLALDDINFSVSAGETFGIIGRNGSGKSTLLHLLMGSMKPNKGSMIETQGRMLRLALGMGFDPNLTARDNVYINGTILGLSFREIGNIFADLIAFAELEDFVDTPVKLFSKGMVARLKFSVAMYAKADIFLIDEFFGAVGDIGFQKKSTRLFEDSMSGRTIVIVTHNLQIIQQHCDRAMVIEKGKQLALGSPEEVIATYRGLFAKSK